MVRVLLVGMAYVLWAFPAYAASTPDFALHPTEWLSQVSLDSLSHHKAIPYRLAFVQSDDGHTLHFLPLPTLQLRALSYLQILDAKSSTYTYLLNSSFMHGSFHSYSNSERWEELSTLLGVNTVVLAEKDKNWVVIGRENGSIVDRIFSRPSHMDPPSLCQWIRQSLGYNGVILAVKQGYFLVASYQQLLKKNGQGLVLQGATTSFFVEETNKKGEALIQAISVAGNVGIFRSVIGTSGAHVQIGDKVILSE